MIMVAAQALVACYIPYAATASFACGVVISLARWLRSEELRELLAKAPQAASEAS